MNNNSALPIGQKGFFPGHSDVREMMEEARLLGGWHECCFRLPDGSLQEAVISLEESAILTESFEASVAVAQSADAILKLSQKENEP